MALMREKYCSKCGKETIHNWDSCLECVKKEEKIKELNWVNMPIEEKIEVLRKRIEKLERGDIRNIRLC